MLAESYNPSSWRQRQDTQKFKTILGYTVRSKPVGNMKDPIENIFFILVKLINGQRLKYSAFTSCLMDECRLESNSEEMEAKKKSEYFNCL